MLTRHVSAVGAEAWPFASGADFLAILEHLAPACILLDMDDSDVPGIEVLAEMVARQIAWPAIAISGREELQLAVEAMKLGAIDFLRMPLSREVLALALAPAWKALERVVEAAEARRAAQERLARLTAREMDVLLALLGGRYNKAIAHDFGISVRTVEMHRAHIMAKLDVKSLAEAALLAPQAGLNLTGNHSAAPKVRGAAAAAAYGPGDCREQLSALARRLAP
ncbi:MAG: LuxR C-terminal-related transcriptional regulator [Pseudomonadota bacterium]|nr:LuxR C-terminal-related transcriptional regulator [Pseudomonadota bacterium]